jgi:hypothetical protein
MSHVEVCTASTRFPRRHAAQCLSTLIAAESARSRAESELGNGARYSLSTANVDLLDPSTAWGQHFSVSVEQALWEDLLQQPRHPAVLGFVASALVAAIPFFGAGGPRPDFPRRVAGAGFPQCFVFRRGALPR